MDKQRAKEIILAHACCSFATRENKLCIMCPWNNTEDCDETIINEKAIVEAIVATKC